MARRTTSDTPSSARPPPVTPRSEAKSSPRSGPLIADEHRRPRSSGPEPVVAAEQRGQRLAEQLGAEWLVGEQRQLPAVDGLPQLGVRVAPGQSLQEIARQASAELVEAARLSAGLGGGDRQHGTDAVRPPVEPLEEDRSRGDRGGRCQPQRGHGVGELAWCVGRLVLGGRERRT